MSIPGATELRRVLEAVMDPEIPVLSIEDLGVLRDVRVDGDRAVVTITPTYSGCPAMRVIEDDIVAALRAHGVEHVTVETTYSPAWTTDWIGPGARAKLEAYGIAPPGMASEGPLVVLERRNTTVRCPFCRSNETELRSQFSSTACKAMWFCNSCHQPFEQFKAF